MKATPIKLTALFFMVFLAASCEEEGPGGNSTIWGNVAHHDELIPGATVFIMYGATEFPGNDTDSYDNSVVANSIDATYEFTGLNKGDYYVWAKGFDSNGPYEVSGGLSVELLKNEDKTINVPVTE